MTFLFTDTEGSTRLRAADYGGMSASLLVHDAILRTAIESHGGYVFTTACHSFAAAFGCASDAVAAAERVPAGVRSKAEFDVATDVAIGGTVSLSDR